MIWSWPDFVIMPNRGSLFFLLIRARVIDYCAHGNFQRLEYRSYAFTCPFSPYLLDPISMAVEHVGVTDSAKWPTRDALLNFLNSISTPIVLCCFSSHETVV